MKLGEFEWKKPEGPVRVVMIDSVPHRGEHVVHYRHDGRPNFVECIGDHCPVCRRDRQAFNIKLTPKDPNDLTKGFKST